MMGARHRRNLALQTNALFSVEEFMALPPEEAAHYELVEGELTEVASGTPEHNIARDELLMEVGLYLRQHPLGVIIAEQECRTTEGTVRRPDLSFFSRSRWEQIDRRTTPVPAAPDIAIEVLSPSESAIAVNRKVVEYFASGSREVWVLDLENQELHQRTLSGGRILRPGDMLTCDLLPEFELPVTAILLPR